MDTNIDGFVFMNQQWGNGNNKQPPHSSFPNQPVHNRFEQLRNIEQEEQMGS